MQLEARALASGVAQVNQIGSAAKRDIFNALIVAQIKLAGQCRSFNVLFQPRPTGESMLAGDGELGVVQAQSRGEYLRVGDCFEARTKLADRSRMEMGWLEFAMSRA